MVWLLFCLLDVSHSFCCHRRTSCGLVVHHNEVDTGPLFRGLVAPSWENPLGKGVQARVVTVQACGAARASEHRLCHGISHVSYSLPLMRSETFLCNLLRNADGDYLVGLYLYTFSSHFSFTEPSFHFGYLDIFGFNTFGFNFGINYKSDPVQSISTCNLQYSLTSPVLPCPADWFKFASPVQSISACSLQSISACSPVVWFKKYGEWMIKEQRMGEASNPGPLTLVLDELIRADEGTHLLSDSAEVLPEIVPADKSTEDHSIKSISGSFLSINPDRHLMVKSEVLGRKPFLRNSIFAQVDSNDAQVATNSAQVDSIAAQVGDQCLREDAAEEPELSWSKVFPFEAIHLRVKPFVADQCVPPSVQANAVDQCMPPAVQESAVDQCLSPAVSDEEVDDDASESEPEEDSDQCMQHAVQHQCMPLAVRQSQRSVLAMKVKKWPEVNQCVAHPAGDNTKVPAGPPGVCPLTRGLYGVGTSGALAGGPAGVAASPISACISACKPQGRRKRRIDGASIISFNGNCWATARDFLIRTDAAVVTLQETKLDGEKLDEAEEWCFRNGWKPFCCTLSQVRQGGGPCGSGGSGPETYQCVSDAGPSSWIAACISA